MKTMRNQPFKIIKVSTHLIIITHSKNVNNKMAFYPQIKMHLKNVKNKMVNYTQIILLNHLWEQRF